MLEQKIKSDENIDIGKNIRRIRLGKNMGQTELIRQLHLQGVSMTRESLVKIERGIQHIYASQLKAIKEILETTYDELLM
ncbi:MAG: helix-turn-helix transcriptional regulator [Oscillospiraceae bacterium]